MEESKRVKFATDVKEGSKNNLIARAKIAKRPDGRSKQSVEEKGDDKDSELKTTPLYRLTTLSKGQHRVSEGKLRMLYKERGTFPEKYRPMIWRFLLKLPENFEAFSLLANMGTHPSFRELYTQIFGGNELATLETCMTILMWWGYSWHVTFPNPPLHITDAIKRVLKRRDGALYSHLSHLKVSPGLMGWAMVSSMFTELLSKDDWMRLMDYLFLNFKRTSLVVIVPVALIISFRSALLSADNGKHVVNYCRRRQGISVSAIIASTESIFATTSTKDLAGCVTEGELEARAKVDDESLGKVFSGRLKGANSKSTSGVSVSSRTRSAKGGPGSVRSNRSGRSRKSAGDDASTVLGDETWVSDSSQAATLTTEGDWDDASSRYTVVDYELDDMEACKRNMSKSAGRAIFPLPTGLYPAYDAFPQVETDWDVKARDKALLLEKQIESRESVMQKLENKISSLQQEHSRWLTRQRAMAENEVQSRRTFMEAERSHMQSMQRLEDSLSSKRLQALSSLESLMAEEREAMAELESSSRQASEESRRHLEYKTETEAQLQKLREVGDRVDIIVDQKVTQMLLEKERDKHRAAPQ